MTVSLASYKVVLQELSSSTKFDNLVQAVENSLNAIGDTTKMAWAAGQILAPSQISQGGGATNQGLIWNGSSWTPTTLRTVYRKTTQKDVVNTVTATDLLNGEITIGAGVMGANGMIRGWMHGDYLNNSGATTTAAFTVALGATTIIATGASGTIAAQAGRRAWSCHFWIPAQGATNSQTCGFLFLMQFDTGLDGAGNAIPLYAFGGGASNTAADMTVAEALTWKVTHGNANANISMRLQSAYVEVMP